MRGGGRPSPRSVDSEIKRCVIEPRNYHCREPSSWTLAGAEPGISSTWSHRRAWSHRGRRNMADDRTGFTGTWETLPSPSQCRPETRLNNSRLIRGPRPRPTGTNEGRNDGIAKRRCTDESQVPSTVMTARVRVRLGARGGPGQNRLPLCGDWLGGHSPCLALTPGNSGNNNSRMIGQITR